MNFRSDDWPDSEPRPRVPIPTPRSSGHEFQSDGLDFSLVSPRAPTDAAPLSPPAAPMPLNEAVWAVTPEKGVLRGRTPECRGGSDDNNNNNNNEKTEKYLAEKENRNNNNNKNVSGASKKAIAEILPSAGQDTRLSASQKSTSVGQDSRLSANQKSTSVGQDSRLSANQKSTSVGQDSRLSANQKSTSVGQDSRLSASQKSTPSVWQDPRRTERVQILSPREPFPPQRSVDARPSPGSGVRSQKATTKKDRVAAKSTSSRSSSPRPDFSPSTSSSRDIPSTSRAPPSAPQFCRAPQSAPQSAPLPSTSPHPNSLRLVAAETANLKDASFDSVAAATDLLRRDAVDDGAGVIGAALSRAASRKTNVPRRGVVFRDLVELSGEEAAVEGEVEKTRRRIFGRRPQPRLPSSVPPVVDGDFSSRPRPDINDFWNPEWEIARPDWSLPGDVRRHSPEDRAPCFDAEKMLEEAGDPSDALERISRDLDRRLKVESLLSN